MGAREPGSKRLEELAANHSLFQEASFQEDVDMGRRVPTHILVDLVVQAVVGAISGRAAGPGRPTILTIRIMGWGPGERTPVYERTIDGKLHLKPSR